MAEPDPWWVNGTLYENCTCQLICPAHVSFKQNCEGERCLGFWGVHVDKGRFGPLVLDEQNALIMYESPPMMHEGGWTVELVLDQGVDAAQRDALERILKGEVGGPWEILSKFVAEQLESRTAPFEYVDDGNRKTLRVEGILEAEIGGIESRKTGQPATLGNLFNVIHSAMQYLARGSSKVDGGTFRWATEDKHALYSEFSWTGP